MKIRKIKLKSKKNKAGAFTDLFIFMIMALIILFVSGMYIYMSNRVSTQIHDTLDNQSTAEKNYTETIDTTFGKVTESYSALYWISIFLIVAMIISIFIGSYLVTTRPIFFVPYIFIVIIAVIVSVGISNAYESVITDETLASTFAGFIGSNYIMLHLPIWITIIGITGGIIMFVRMKGEEYVGYQ